MKFDVIVGNPPYQENNDIGNRKQLSHNLYSKISLISFRISKLEGIVSLIVPTSWMSSSSSKESKSKNEKKMFKNLFKEKYIEYLNINNINAFKGIGSLFSYFIIRNINMNNSKTVVNCRYKNNEYISKIDFKKNFYWFPILLTKETISIINKTCWNKELIKMDIKNSNFYHPVVVNGHKSRSLSKDKDNKNIYPLYHTNAKIKWGNEPTENQYMKKVLFSKSGYIKPIYDSGIFGTTDAAFWISVESEKIALNIINIINLKLYKFILEISKWSGFNMPEVLYSLPSVDFSRSWSDQDLYEYFNLTQKEINFIEAGFFCVTSLVINVKCV